MIFETPTDWYPPKDKEVKQTANTSGIQLYINREMTSMVNALKASDNGSKTLGVFESCKKVIANSSKIVMSFSAERTNFAATLLGKLSQYASGSIGAVS